MSDSLKWHRYLRFWRPNIAADVDDESAFNAERRANVATDLGRDVKVALRALRRSPGLITVVVLTFALGIGVTSAIYSVVDTFMFRPLPGAYGGDLIMLARTERALTRPHELSFPDYRDFRRDTSTFATLAAYETRTAELETDRGAERLLIDDGPANYFSTLGLEPMLGRTFAPGDDDGVLAHPEIVVSYKAWVAHFDADSSVVGRVIRVNEHPINAIGVMPPAFHGVRSIIDIDASCRSINSGRR